MTTRLDLQGFLPYRLSIAATAVSKRIARAYADRFGLSIPQWRCVAVLGERASATQQDLCAATLMDKVAVSRAAAGLEARHLIVRVEDQRDGRARRGSLTAEGRSLYEAIVPLALHHEADILADLSADDIHTLTALLAKIEVAARRGD